MAQTSITKQKITADGELIFSYHFDYSRQPVAISVTISQPGQDTGAESPPDPPEPTDKTPETYDFVNGRVTFALKMTNGNPIDGSMEVRALTGSSNGDDMLIWSSVFYGFNRLRHFVGTTVTFSSTLDDNGASVL